jgi:hypothetical protein
MALLHTHPLVDKLSPIVLLLVRNPSRTQDDAFILNRLQGGLELQDAETDDRYAQAARLYPRKVAQLHTYLILGDITYRVAQVVVISIERLYLLP